MIIIPAIDIIDGKCVRLVQGDFNQKKIYDYEPVEFAKKLESIGVQRLHVVDLDGAKKGEIQNIKTLENIVSKTKLIIDYSGGIHTTENVQSVFNAGAAIISIGSIAVKNPALVEKWLTMYPVESFMIGADVKKEFICVQGWLEKTSIQLVDFLDQYLKLGIQHFFCTDIEYDGLLKGPSIPLYKKILQQFKNINLIASGGVSSMDDIHQLKNIGCSGAIIGKALYENKISFESLKKYLENAN